MVPLFLALVWAAVLIPPLWRKRKRKDVQDSVFEFRRNLRILEVASPAASSLASSNSGSGLPIAWAREARRVEIAKRRRFVSQVLILGTVVSLLLSLIPELRFMVVFHAAFIAALGYFAFLLQKQRRQIVQAYMELSKTEKVIPKGQPVTHVQRIAQVR